MNKPKLVISQSLIKELLRKGDELPDHKICYRKIFAKYILGLRTDPSDAMKNGLLFEDLCCDTNNNNIELAKHNKSGRKLTTELRIEQQAHIFKEWVRSVEGVVNETNSQIVIFKKWEVDRKVILRGVLDIFPFVHYDINTGELIISILDIKMTGNITTTYGKFCWGEPERMDHLQAVFYSYLVRDIDYNLNDALNPGNNLRVLTESIRNYFDSGQCTFKYYVADTKSNFDSDVIKYKLKPDDFAEMHESIRKTVFRLRDANEEEWPANPNSINCLGDYREGTFTCPFINCSSRLKEREI